MPNDPQRRMFMAYVVTISDGLTPSRSFVLNAINGASHTFIGLMEGVAYTVSVSGLVLSPDGEQDVVEIGIPMQTVVTCKLC